MSNGSPHSTTKDTLGIALPLGWRILIVDDYRDSAETLAELLRLSGNECFVGYSGRECIALARWHRPEIILLDLNMPEMDGFATYDLLRDESWSRGLKIIAVTAMGEESYRRRTSEVGFDAHIVKPVDPEELAMVLSSFATKRQDPKF